MKHEFAEYKAYIIKLILCEICDKDDTDLHFPEYGRYHSTCLDELMKNE